MRAKWAAGGRMDEAWDTDVEQLKTMGLERFVKIKEEAPKR